MASATNSLLGIYLKQISHVFDQVADFVNFYGFKNTANLLEKSKNVTTVELSCNKTQNLTETFNEYGYVTLGITWLPGEYILLTNKDECSYDVYEYTVVQIQMQ